MDQLKINIRGESDGSIENQHSWGVGDKNTKWTKTVVPGVSALVELAMTLGVDAVICVRGVTKLQSSDEMGI